MSTPRAGSPILVPTMEAPASPEPGHMYLTATGWLRVWSGSAWMELSPAALARGTTAQRPAAAVDGRLYFNTDLDQLEVDTGLAWEAAAPPAAGGGGGRASSFLTAGM